MRSRTGCLTCRQRKLKCGEEKPICGNCIKASRECIPCSGITFRHQQNASLNGSHDDANTNASLGKYFSYKNTFDDKSVWVDIPRNITFVHTDNPFEDPPSPELEPSNTSPQQSTSSLHEQPPPNVADWGNLTTGATQPNVFASKSATFAIDSPSRIEGVSPVAESSRKAQSAAQDHDYGARPILVTSSESTRSLLAQSGLATTPSTSNNLNFILNHPLSSASSPTTPGFFSQVTTAERAVKRKHSTSSHPSVNDRLFIKAERDHEVAFLLRYFAEGPGHWMDLYDLGLYFSNYVPIKALRHPLLKFSAVALAAKALGRIDGKKPIYGGKKSRLGRTEELDIKQGHWMHKAAAYYDQAICLLRQKIMEESSGESPVEHQHRASVDSFSAKRPRLGDLDMSCPHAVELLVATAILSVYEFLDASNPEWSQHLNGAKSLLDIAKESMVPFSHLLNPRMFTAANQNPTMRARKATFWVIARQDMLAALITDTHTRINTEDLDLWREAGLLIDEDGMLLASSDDMLGSTREDLIANGLVWLQMKLVNLMSSRGNVPAETGYGSKVGFAHRPTEYWDQLFKQLQNWFDTLPKTFVDCARLEAEVPASSPMSHTHEFDDVSPLPEIWYSMPLCASAMQHHFMSRILLLTNKPSTTSQGHVSALQQCQLSDTVLEECRTCAQEVVSIGLGRDQAALRVHSVQPLFFAGQCLTGRSERKVCLTLLREIEADTGWATGYRCKQLLQQWGLENDPSFACT